MLRGLEREEEDQKKDDEERIRFTVPAQVAQEQIGGLFWDDKKTCTKDETTMARLF